ncbi:MAG TPA: hypothetical protein VLX09_16605 [Stellaceae bacterium]|nr:hypothetical protein [Stellaceae bacterium]HUK09496.1 hypothetical protein [Stellaceae bacterium]
MKIAWARAGGIVTAVLACAIVAGPPLGMPSAFAALYSDDATSITGGPILDRDYWRASWDSMRLEDALKERQPEGAILIAVIGQIQLLDELIKKYPNDAELKKWKARADEIKAKIDPDADRRAEFKPGCLWNEGNYKEAYVNVNYAKTAIDKQDWAAAKDGLNYAERNLGFLRDRIKNNDRVAAWPPGAADWVTQASAEVAKETELVNSKLK